MVEAQYVIEDLKRIKDNMENDNLTEDQCYNLIENFKKSIYRLSDLSKNQNVSEQDIKMLDYIYSYMYDNSKFNILHEEFKWSILDLEILNIKINKKQLDEHEN